MKSLLAWLFVSLVTCMCFCACTEKSLSDAEGTNDDTGGVYMRLTLNMSATTKSSTDSTDDNDYGSSNANEDTEVGSDSENDVESVLVVLYSEDNSASTLTYNTSLSNSTVTAVFKSKELESMAGSSVNVYVICNVTAEYTFSNLNDVYTLTSATDGTPWTEYKFYMASAKPKEIKLDEDLTQYDNSDKACDLGDVYVERCCARFDYADASGDNNTYAIETYDSENGLFLPTISSSTSEFSYTGMEWPSYTVNIQLTDLALCNLSKEFYMIRRVIAGKDTDDDGVNDKYDSDKSQSYCGTETSSNFVVDTDWSSKSNYDGTNYDTENFYYTLNSFSGLQFTSISTILGGTDDNWTNKDNSYDYKVWRYATENTIPSVDKQLAGLSTGVVFKGKIGLDGDSTSPFAYAFSEGNTDDLFSINGCLWGTWKDVELYAKVTNSNTTPQFPALHVSYTNAVSELNGDTDAASIRKVAINNGFTVYSYDTEEECYPVYYYYWNRHNDNTQSSVMGPMEFAVVRNNVYKLAVTAISGYGYGVDEEGEPDVPDPDDPDETDDVYFRVSLEILPWVVRVNNITL